MRTTHTHTHFHMGNCSAQPQQPYLKSLFSLRGPYRVRRPFSMGDSCQHTLDTVFLMNGFGCGAAGDALHQHIGHQHHHHPHHPDLAQHTHMRVRNMCAVRCVCVSVIHPMYLFNVCQSDTGRCARRVVGTIWLTGLIA